jgi:hypothetical protein
MKYSTPELIVLGLAHVLVLGGEPGLLENMTSEHSKPLGEMSIGLDD